MKAKLKNYKKYKERNKEHKLDKERITRDKPYLLHLNYRNL